MVLQDHGFSGLDPDLRRRQSGGVDGLHETVEKIWASKLRIGEVHRHRDRLVVRPRQPADSARAVESTQSPSAEPNPISSASARNSSGPNNPSDECCHDHGPGRFSGFDVVINNAGNGIWSPVEALTPEQELAQF